MCIGREGGRAAGLWWCDLSDITRFSGKCSAGLCPGRAGDVWGRGSWDWNLSILLPCVWQVIGGKAPCGRDDSQLFLCGRDILSQGSLLCHLSPSISLKWQGICCSRSDRRFVAHYGGASGIPGWSAERPGYGFPIKSRSEPEQRRGPSPSQSRDQRWAQKASVATHAPPPPAGRARGRRRSERGKTWGRCSRRGILNNTLVRTDEIGLRSPQHGSMGISFPIATPRGRSSKFPWRGTSQVAYVTMVPRVRNETLRPLGCVPCFGRKLQTKKWMMYSTGALCTVVVLVVMS